MMALCESISARRDCVPRALLTQPPENVNVGSPFLSLCFSLFYHWHPLHLVLYLYRFVRPRELVNPIWKWYLPLIIFVKYLLHILLCNLLWNTLQAMQWILLNILTNMLSLSQCCDFLKILKNITNVRYAKNTYIVCTANIFYIN